jgi:hypothetical protein
MSWQLAIVAASFAVSALQNRSASKLGQAQQKMEMEQANLAAAEATLIRTKELKSALSMQLAQSAAGVGGATGFRQAAGQSMANYTQDVRMIANQARNTALTARSNMGALRLNEMSGGLQSLTNAVSLASRLDLFKRKP